MRHSVPISLLLLTLGACSDGTTITRSRPSHDATLVADESESAQNSILFPKTSQPFGASLITWAERESQWVYGHPVAHNPLIDRTGEDCDESQTFEHVWFIPRIAGPRVFSGSRTCTIPAGRAIFLEIGAYVNEYPCPDPNFHPVPGQSMFDFLTQDARAFMNGVNRLEVSLDGRELDDVLSYRFASQDVFTLTGDPSFATLDPCVTGGPQPTVVDGFFMMFKPLDPGEHTIRVFGTDVRGANKTYIYHLSVIPHA
jgi:hypothetical protein